jgi:hypothetical protein
LKAKIRDGNYIYVHSDGEDRPSVLMAIRKDIERKHYGGSRNADKVGIEMMDTKCGINQSISQESPEWVKPTAEEENWNFGCLFLWFGLCYVSCFVLIMHCF